MIILLGVVASILFFAVYRHFTWRAQVWPTGAMAPVKYQGHRGYWKAGVQENTLASFKAAKERGLEMVEMDVRLSKDQVVVVFHDDDLKRLAHQQKAVSEMTADELARAAQVCTLEDVLISKEIPQLLNIELKTNRVRDGVLEEAVAKVVRKHQAEKRILFSSFNPLCIYRLGRILPEVPRALLASKENDPTNKFYLKHMWFAPYIGANLLHLDYKYVSLSDLAKWKKRGVPVAFWTVNDAQKARELLDHGAVSIITDTLIG
ncbi:glycerophosphodiester phosphodiesterase [Bdellovibrio svalbardensis]|uniref:Glycerophosphodiester phosphodiesterase n=1 Tax=Bdellovibrio svalbardensis TaxID=2972972 RepID=A0ABT6DHN1_9BACT|nr:glycerophosphodiester phosphodiesterase [Bdellovibrio svalbardensis]MDG0816367.1 glycerophosphodiester phosphodiesterase [Bdellovibrio svalbardensis]